MVCNYLRNPAVVAVLVGAAACGTSNPGSDVQADAKPNDAPVSDIHDVTEAEADAADSTGRTVDAQEDGGADSGSAPEASPDGDASESADSQSTIEAGRDGGESDSATVPDVAPIRDAGSDADAGGDAMGGSCGNLTTGPATNGGDVTYAWADASVPNCLSEPFCQVPCAGELLAGLLACDPVQGGYFWAQGSAYIRVAGKQAGTCVYEIGVELEGTISYSRCTAPIPVAPWKGLYYVSSLSSSAEPDLTDGLDNCQMVTMCSIPEDGPNPCDLTTVDPPECPTYGASGAC
jgi:hypothetical protein